MKYSNHSLAFYISINPLHILCVGIRKIQNICLLRLIRMCLHICGTCIHFTQLYEHMAAFTKIKNLLFCCFPVFPVLSLYLHSPFPTTLSHLISLPQRLLSSLLSLPCSYIHLVHLHLLSHPILLPGRSLCPLPVTLYTNISLSYGLSQLTLLSSRLSSQFDVFLSPSP